MLTCPCCKEELKSINIIAPHVIVIDNYDIEGGYIDIADCQRMDEIWDNVDYTEIECPICGEELPKEIYSQIKDIEKVIVGEY